MIAEISLAIGAVKAANEALGVIREGISNCQSIGQLGASLTKLTDAEDEIKKKATDGDMDAFFALEKINQQKAEIKQMMIYSGRAGLWEDWQRFQATRRELRQKEQKRIAAKKARQRKMMVDATVGTLLALSILTAVGLIGYIFYYIAKSQ